MDTLSYKTKQFFFVLIKLSIVVAAFCFIYYKLTNNSHLNFSEFVEFTTKNHVFSLKNSLFLIILTSFNWFFEIVKWQKLVSPIKKISLKNAINQSLGALTASLFTPNRIGEYGAKAMFYPKALRKRILLINLLSNAMQMTITTIFGVFGLYFFIREFPIEINYSNIIIILTTGVLVLTFGFFVIRKYEFTIRGFQIKKNIDFISHFPKRVIFYGVTFSLIRYLIFSFQFYFLLGVFGIDLDYFNAMCVITSIYLLASIIPSIFIFDVVIKGSVAVYLFSFLGVDQLTVIVIITLMWLFNFVLPSVLGSYFVLRFNIPKTPVHT